MLKGILRNKDRLGRDLGIEIFFHTKRFKRCLNRLPQGVGLKAEGVADGRKLNTFEDDLFPAV